MVMSFSGGGDEKGNDALWLPEEVFKADFHRRRRFEVLQTFRGQRTAPPPPTHTPPPPDDRKDQYFCWVSINVGSSSQCTAANPTPGVIFTSVGRLLFPSRSETGY